MYWREKSPDLLLVYNFPNYSGWMGRDKSNEYTFFPHDFSCLKVSLEATMTGCFGETSLKLVF